MEHIVIIGNGISGITAARHIRKYSDKKISIIAAEAEHFFSRTALMYVYMGHMRWKDIEPYEEWFWAKNRLELLHARVDRISPEIKTLYFTDGRSMQYDKLILAVGSKTTTYGWVGLDLPQVLGLVSKQDLERLEEIAPNKDECPKAVIVGGGLIGVELAEMLRTREIDVTFLVRENTFWSGVLPPGEGQMISRHISSHGVDLRHNTGLEQVLADEHGNVRAVLTNGGDEIPCSMVGITTGVSPSIDFLEGSTISTDKGILVNRRLETNWEGVYAIGDCAQQKESLGLRAPVEAVWYTGRIMGETVARTICGQPTEYKPGHWFNSAKFFDIEYQTYGWVFSGKRKKDYEMHFHWMHRDEDKCITVAYHKDSRKFLGINTFGIRMRHEVFNNWLNEEKTVDYVIEHLKDANFDPEFYRAYEGEIMKAYYYQINQPVI